MPNDDRKTARDGEIEESLDFVAHISNFSRPAVDASGRGTGGHGDRVRDPAPDVADLRRPTSVYLIYIKFNPAGALRIRHAEVPLGGNLVAARAQALRNARDGTNLSGRNFRAIIWDDPCYVVLTIDNPGWQVYWGNDPDHNTIRFQRRKDVDGSAGPDLYKENFSFYDGDRIQFDVDGQLYDAFQCINYVRDENGNLGRRQKRDYCFEIYLQAPFETVVGDEEPRITILIDPDGQNQGPRT